jgi:L-threonylcarbamoyladenylate synthase
MFTISNPGESDITSAAKALISGALVGIPTETVYGLAADAENEAAVARIYAVKGRPQDHPVIVHIGSMDQLNKWANNIPDYALKLAKEYWPGPMTLILERSEIAKDFITGGQETVGLRVPAHTTTLALLEEFQKLGGNGIAAPSANRFGAVSPTNAEAVQSEIGEFLNASRDLIIDGGQSLVGVESTIIDCTEEFPIILRPGAISIEMIFGTTGLISKPNIDSKIRVSGSLDQHYSPKAKILLSGKAYVGDGFIALKVFDTPEGAVRLASPETLEEFARTLYSALREGDKRGINRIVIIPPEGDGLAIAIRDRLTRAAR